VLVLLVASTLQFGHLVRGLSELQISNTLHVVGNRGRAVIAAMFLPSEDPRAMLRSDRGEAKPDDDGRRPVQVLRYAGEPRAIGRFDVEALVRQAQRAGAVIELACAVGDTILDGSLLLTVSGAAQPLIDAQ